MLAPLLIALLAALRPGLLAPPLPPPLPLPPIYTAMCAPCHGETGAGDGPAADLLWPRPTPLLGAPLPLGDDPASIRRAITRGVPGTAMPAFGHALPPEAIDALISAIAREPTPPLDPTPLDPTPPHPDPPPPRLDPDRWNATGCATCHGPTGAGDGPLAPTLRDANGDPADLYDLRTTPLKTGDDPAALFTTLTHGRPGTPMPAFATLPATDRHALVAHLRALRRDATPQTAPQTPTLRLPPPNAPLRARDPHWNPRPLRDPGPPPPDLLPPLTDPTPTRCATCHPAQHATWTQSRHAAAAGPGLLAQYHHATPTFTHRCNACHAPLAAQQTDPDHHAQGITCAACHLRAHQKHGPPAPTSIRISAPALAARPDPRFTRSDFCLPCHNLPLTAAIAGRPLLDTWREWATSPYLPAGIQCQHCHQPDGDHSTPGAHDPAMARRAIRLDFTLTHTPNPLTQTPTLTATATLQNIGAGHHFPTTATPRAILRIRQLTPQGPIPHTTQAWAIGRTLRHDGRTWTELADTRIPAGSTLTRRYHHPRAPDATRLEASLHLFPDWFYTRFYRTALRRADLTPAARADYQTALAEAEASAILIDYRRLPLPPTETPGPR